MEGKAPSRAVRNSALSCSSAELAALCASLELHPPLSAKGQRWIPFPRKPMFWLGCFGRLYEKGSGSWIASKLALHLPDPFSARVARSGRRSRPGLPHLLCGCARGGRRFAAVKRAGFTSAPPQRRLPSASRTKAAVRRALPCGFAKQTEKDGESHGIELARIPEILRLFQLTAAPST